MDIANEIEQTKKLLRELERHIPITKDELDCNLLMEEIISLETKIRILEEKRGNLLQWDEYAKQCTHEFVLDLVDINPDKSKIVKYCKHCLCVPEH